MSKVNPETVIAEYRTGKNLRQVGVTCGISFERVRQILVANGVERRPWGASDTIRARQAARAAL